MKLRFCTISRSAISSIPFHLKSMQRSSIVTIGLRLLNPPAGSALHLVGVFEHLICCSVHSFIRQFIRAIEFPTKRCFCVQLNPFVYLFTVCVFLVSV